MRCQYTTSVCLYVCRAHMVSIAYSFLCKFFCQKFPKKILTEKMSKYQKLSGAKLTIGSVRKPQVLLEFFYDLPVIFGPRRWVPESHSGCSCSCCWYQFSRVQKIPKAFFLICSGAQRNFACTFVLTLPTDLLYRLRFFTY